MEESESRQIATGPGTLRRGKKAKACQEVPGVSFSRGISIFSCDFLKCCMYVPILIRPARSLPKCLYSRFISTSHVLEDFLDFHGAKNSQQWYFYRELTAAVRHISLGAYSLKHVLTRLAFYDLPETGDFSRQGERRMIF